MAVVFGTKISFMKLQNIMGHVGYVQVVHLKMNNVTKLNVLMICDMIKQMFISRK